MTTIAFRTLSLLISMYYLTTHYNKQQCQFPWLRLPVVRKEMKNEWKKTADKSVKKYQTQQCKNSNVRNEWWLQHPVIACTCNSLWWCSHSDTELSRSIKQLLTTASLVSETQPGCDKPFCTTHSDITGMIVVHRQTYRLLAVDKRNIPLLDWMLCWLINLSTTHNTAVTNILATY